MPYSERPNSLFNNYGIGVLKNVAGPKKQKLGGWRKLHKQGIYGCQFSLQIIYGINSKEMRQAERMASMGDRKDFGGKSRGSRPLRRTRHRWEDNGTNWISLPQNRET